MDNGYTIGYSYHQGPIVSVLLSNATVQNFAADYLANLYAISGKNDADFESFQSLSM